MALSSRDAGPVMIAGLVGVMFSAGLSVYIARRVARPLRNFDTAAMSIARGKFGVQVEVAGDTELADLAKTFNYMSAQIEAYDHETQRLYEDIEAGYLETMVALANSIDSKDSYTRGHSQRVAEMAVEIGRELKLTERELKQLRYGGILHDIGKIGIVEAILLKKSSLTDEEMQVMRQHPSIGDGIIQPVSFLKEIRAAVRCHHEWWNGTGYPDGLKGEKIPFIARVVSVADTWDACTTTRPYSRALPEAQALEVMQKLRGTHLDPGILDAFLKVIEKKSQSGAESVKLAV
ncbi:MAG: HD domain-containing protein [Archangiaceae bacterium]|nr:HD domain-containing protein [Archangiaceae bacterium]